MSLATPGAWLGIRERLAAGTTTAVEALGECFARIERADGQLRAFLRLHPDAMQQAEDADRRLQRGEGGAWTGVPVAIKDNLATAGVETTCASRCLEGYVPHRDATAVRRLREAGAVIVGKTNLDEFGMGSSNENSAFGVTRNPWDLDRVPGGSSGGSAAAVAGGMVPLALGSDTGGSIRQPAAFCGTVGVKPTYGRVSRSGLVAFGSSLDQVGPICASVEDAASALELIAGADPEDQTASHRPVEPYAACCGHGVDGLTVGLPRQYRGPGVDPEIVDATEAAAAALASHGASLREVDLPLTEFAIPAYYVVATAEASSNLARYDGVRYGRREAASGLEAMYELGRTRNLGPEVQRRILLGTFALSSGYHDEYYGKAQRARTLLRREFQQQFDAGVDLLLTPTTPTTAFRLGEKLDDPLAMYLSDVFTVTANLTGVPALSVPSGRSRNGLPIGVQLIGPHFGETILFRAATVIESSQHRALS